jgi:hypothetical protein
VDHKSRKKFKQLLIRNDLNVSIKKPSGKNRFKYVYIRQKLCHICSSYKKFKFYSIDRLFPPRSKKLIASCLNSLFVSHCVFGLNEKESFKSKNTKRTNLGCQMGYFQTKIPNLGKKLGACNWRGWYILWPFGLFYRYFMTVWYILWPFGTFYDRLVHFMTVWYILCSFDTFFPVLVSCTKKNLAILVDSIYDRLVYLLVIWYNVPPFW